jgi:hypothetical protein
MKFSEAAFLDPPGSLCGDHDAPFVAFAPQADSLAHLFSWSPGSRELGE